MDLEVSQVFLNNGLTFLYVSLGVMVIIVGGFLTKLIFDCSKLAKNVNETTKILNTELEPTIKELNKTIKSFNDIVQNTGEGMGTVKLGIENILNKTKMLSGSIFGGFVKGFMTVYSIFSKKK